MSLVLLRGTLGGRAFEVHEDCTGERCIRVLVEDGKWWRLDQLDSAGGFATEWALAVYAASRRTDAEGQVSDWTKARDEVKAQATSVLISTLIGWFRRKLARRKAPAIVEPEEVGVMREVIRPDGGTDFVMRVRPKAPRG